MSVGKNSIRRAAGKTVEKEIPGAAPELANSCVTPAPKKPAAKASKPAAKASKSAAASKTAAKKAPAAKPATEETRGGIPTPVAVEAKVNAPAASTVGSNQRVEVTQDMPYYLL